jgi:REP element-mobilizing transposase RayT
MFKSFVVASFQLALVPGTMSPMPTKPPRGPDTCANLVDPRDVPFSFGRSRGTLPHLYKDGCTTFVTFCLIDAVPKKAEQRRRLRGDDDRSRHVALQSEPMLDSGSMILRRSELAEIVERALAHFQGQRYDLHAWVVMPNHVHAVLTPYDGHGVARILHSWKSFTATAINRCIGRTGQLWQHESFDHLVRDQESLVRLVCYVEENPVAAGLCQHPEEWPFSSARFRR